MTYGQFLRSLHIIGRRRANRRAQYMLDIRMSIGALFSKDSGSFEEFIAELQQTEPPSWSAAELSEMGFGING